jgi:hypothetical protein
VKKIKISEAEKFAILRMDNSKGLDPTSVSATCIHPEKSLWQKILDDRKPPD